MLLTTQKKDIIPLNVHKEAATIIDSGKKDGTPIIQSARDTSKPNDPAPIPPPLPEGWPPRAPTTKEEQIGAAAPSRNHLLSSLFSKVGGTPEVNVRKRSTIVPTIKLKQVHWDMVMVTSVEGTVWDTSNETGENSIASVSV
jgi:hypothetical protein